jgi:2-haloacid dehalogenase
LISVDGAKIYKPSPQAYAFSPQHLKLSTSSIAFVSSNFWDAAEGKSFGYWTRWVNRAGLPEDEIGAKPDAVVHDLDELILFLNERT